MVDLGFNVKKGYGLSNADDVRSVVKNATKDINMSESKDKTIMTSDELREKKAKEIINDKKSKVVPTAKTQNQTVNNKSSINVNTSKIGGDILNKNVMVGGVDNIKPETIKNNEGNVVKETGIKVNNIGNDFGGGIEGITKDLSGIGGTTISPEQMNKKKEEINQRRELTKEAMNYVGEFANSVNDSIVNGEEDRLTIENIRKAFPEFNSLDDKQLGDLTRDIYNANKLGNEFNLYNYALKHPELYMEFDNSEQIGNVGRADYLDAMFNSSDASSKPGLFKIMTLGLAPNELGILDTTTLDETDIGDEGKTFMNNAWKSVWNAVALTYNFLSHPLESAKMLGGSVLGMGADYALKKQAEEEGISKDEFVQGLINNMGDGSSLSDKITRLLVNGGEMGGLMKDFFKTNYGSAEGFLNYLYSDPAGAISDIVSIGELGVGLAGKMGLIEKGAVKSINKTLGWIDPYEATGRALLGYENVPGALGVATRAEGKVLKGVTKGIRKASGNVVDFVLNKMTGIGEEQRKFIKENPDLAMKYIKGEETAQDIAERIMNKFNELGDEKKAEGERYNLIRNNGNLSVKIGDAINKIKDVFGELGIKISDGKLKFSDISYSDAQKRALQNVYKYVDSLSKRGDEASVSDVWRVRQLIDNAINWEGNSKMGLDAEVMNTIKNMRNKVDDALKSQVEGFKDIDNNYSRIINAIKELKKDWFNKDGSLKDNALSKIRNLTNKGNEKKLERLEKYLPGIGEDARALGVAEVIDKVTKQNVGQYLQQGLVGGGLVGLGALMTGGVSTAGVITALGMMGVLTPKNFVKVLSAMGKVGEKIGNSAVAKGAKKVGEGMDWIKNVGEKIIKGEKLSESQIEAIEKLTSENMREFMANPEKYVDYEYDRAQKSAYLGHESTEKKLLEEEIKKLDKKYEKKMKDIGFVRDVEDGILRDSEGYSLLKEKLYNWRKDAGDTTRQHEFFHSVFSVVDDKTYRYVLDEAKKYLNLDENKLGSKADEVADEWLAESFGVYIRRKEIKSGEIRLKGNRLERFNSKIKDLFQRAYEWIQGYIVDRDTIDKLFDEVYGGVKLNDAGKVDLAEKLGINNKKLGGVENNKGLRYKKSGKRQNFDYNATNGQADRPLLGNLSTTEGEMKQATHDRRGQANRGADTAEAKRVSSSNTANFFEQSDNKGEYIEYKDGNREVEKIYKMGEEGGSEFGDYKENLNKGLEGYKKNLLYLRDELNKDSKGSESRVIGKTGKGKDIMMTKQSLKHWYEKHGGGDFNTIINAINNPTNQLKEVFGTRYRYEVKLNDGSTLVVGLQPMERMGNGKVRNVLNSRDADFYSVTGITKGEGRKADSMEVRLKRTYHGSPHEFDKFDSSHMGEGEGAQAHGWGHYVAVNRNTAEGYAKMQKLEKMRLDGRKLEEWIEEYKKEGGGIDNPKLYARAEVAKRLEMGDSLLNAKSMAKYNAEEYIKSIQGVEKVLDGKKYIHAPTGLYTKDAWEKAVKMHQDLIDEVDNISRDMYDDGVKGNRNLYDVEIPDPVKRNTPTGKNYLEEGGVLSEKAVEKFRKAFKEYGNELLEKFDDFGVEMMEYYGHNDQGKGIYNFLDTALGGKKNASKFLESLGYDGIHYFGGRDGEAYVIFNDDNMDIRDHIRYKKDNKGLEAKEKTNTNNFKNWFGNSIAKADNGEPKVLYHGTVGKFDAFDRNRIGSNAQRLGPGFYFTNDKKVAKEYTTRLNSLGEKVKYAGDEPSVKEVYVSLQNPLKFNEELVDEKAIKKVLMEGDKDYYFNNTIPFKVNGNEFLGRKWTREEVEKLPKSKKVDLMLEYIKRGINERDYGRLNEELLGETTRAFNNKGDVLDYLMKYTGKDGVYAKDWKGLEQYVTWNEGQQKYTNNVGTFDKNNPDMRYKKDKLRQGEINYGEKGLQYKGEISRGKVKEYLSKEMNKESLIKNIGRYDEAKESFDADLKRWAKELGGKEVTTSIKMRNMDGTLREDGIERILEKQKKYGKIGGVKDIVRGTIIVEGKEGLKKALDMFYGDGRGVDDKYEFIGVNDMGYRDLSFNYWTKNGIPSEVQVNVPEMMVAKEGENLVKWGFISRKKYDSIVEKAGVEGGKGHKMYEEWRKLKEKLDDEKDYSKKREIMGKMGEIEKNSRKYYKKFEDLIK